MTAGHTHGSPECREVFAKLSEYLDNELDDELKTLVEDHNADCVACEKFLASLRATVDLVGDQAAETLPARARQAIHEDYEARFESSGGDS